MRGCGGRLTSVVAGLAILVVFSAKANAATIIDLGSNDFGSANGALYEWTAAQPTGTGVIDSFVRIQANGTEQGYNHSLGGQVPWDTKSGLFTHDIQYEDLVTRTVLGIDYYEFLLDINEAASEDKRWLSLDNVQIFTRSSPITSADESLDDLGTLRFDSDSGGDVTVNLDYSRNHGSGSGDMFLLVPVSLFAGTLPSDYVYFYSAFGGMNASDAGFEEWALRQSQPLNSEPIPEPGSMILLGSGLLYAARRFRTRPQVP
ncbi:MAG TPA: PEP-CTERM sorting domain-containing protein [Vicinamibacterales bacterium]|nr:PEP-CTERM sorting domain-containing protein [Vicinamibacterales bacterium]